MKKGMIAQYRDLKAKENRLFLELVQVRTELAVVEGMIFDADSAEVLEKKIDKPEQLAAIWASKLASSVKAGVLEYENSRDVLERWAENERFSPTFEFTHRGTREEFLRETIWALYRHLSNSGIKWQSSGWSIMHNKRRMIDRLVAVIKMRLEG
jgi:hypothetical protein